jgi:hypothetical protein
MSYCHFFGEKICSGINIKVPLQMNTKQTGGDLANSSAHSLDGAESISSSLREFRFPSSKNNL